MSTTDKIHIEVYLQELMIIISALNTYKEKIEDNGETVLQMPTRILRDVLADTLEDALSDDVYLVYGRKPKEYNLIYRSMVINEKDAETWVKQWIGKYWADYIVRWVSPLRVDASDILGSPPPVAALAIPFRNEEDYK